MDARQLKDLESGRLVMLYAWLTDSDTHQNHLASLGGICVSRTEQMAQPHARVVEAELASEARHQEAQISKGWAS